MTFVAESGIALVRILLGFYGFWLVWRVILPLLPGPEVARERIAPFAGYFTDPWVVPVARALRVSVRLVSAGLLVGVAAGRVALDRLAATL